METAAVLLRDTSAEVDNPFHVAVLFLVCIAQQERRSVFPISADNLPKDLQRPSVIRSVHGAEPRRWRRKTAFFTL